MSTVADIVKHDIVKSMHNNPATISFAGLCRVYDHCFGDARQAHDTHRVHKTPWIGDPRLNIQNDKGESKTYHVKQVLKTIERLEIEHGTEKR